MLKGKDYILSSNENKYFSNLLNYKIKSDRIYDVYYEIYYYFLNKYNHVTKFKTFIELEPIGNYSKFTLDKRKIDNNTLKNITHTKCDLIKSFFCNIYDLFFYTFLHFKRL